MMKYRELYQKGVSILQSAGIAEATLDARLLLEFCCHTDHNMLLVHPELEVEAQDVSWYMESLKQRAKRIPLQQITGEQEFMGLSFFVNEHVLIPRQDTEILVELAQKEIGDGDRILDMCTGSGCILLSLLWAFPQCTGVGVDLSEQALEVAERNAQLLEMDSSRVTFLQSNLFEKVEGTYDVLVSNPPYIRSDVIPTLMEEVREHEPILALDGHEDGLFFYRRIVEEAVRFLKEDGKLFFEIGYDQAEAVKKLLQDAGFQKINCYKDYAGLDRVVAARR